MVILFQVLPRLKVLILPNLRASLAHYENMKKKQSEQQQDHSSPTPQ